MKHVVTFEVDRAPKSIRELLTLLLEHGIHVYETRPVMLVYSDSCTEYEGSECKKKEHHIAYANLGSVVIEVEPIIFEMCNNAKEFRGYRVYVYDNTVAETECSCDCYVG